MAIVGRSLNDLAMIPISGLIRTRVGPLIARDALVMKWIDIEEKLEMLAGGKTNLTITHYVTREELRKSWRTPPIRFNHLLSFPTFPLVWGTFQFCL
ncbi:MAG: hypothetical protein V1850_03010 [Candidatus Bathyarchaeota archaeon]